MKTNLTITMTILTIWLTSCGGGFGTDRPKSAEELKAELKQQEQISPTTYIEDENVTLTPQKKKIRNAGLFHDAEYAPDGAIIEGNFISKSTVAKFKDIVVNVSFYSQTKTLIEEKSYVLYQYLNPNSTIHFSMKIDALPQAYKEFGFEITGATPTE